MLNQIKRTINRLRMRRAIGLARAYDWLIHKSDDPYFPYAQTNAAYETPLDPPADLVAWLVPWARAEDAENYVRQAILSMTKIRSVQALILAARDQAKRRTYALPAPWRHTLRQRGVEVGKFSSALAWFKLQLSVWRGVLANRRLLLERAQSGWATPDRDYAVALGVPQAATKHGIRPDGYTFVDWLTRTPDLLPQDEMIVIGGQTGAAAPSSGERMAFADHPLPALPEERRSRFKKDSRNLLARALLLWLRGESWAPFLAGGALEAEYFKLIPHPAKRYIFTIAAGMLMRPFWTYRAEWQGIPSTLVYYATNIKPIAGKFPYAFFPSVQTQYWRHYVAFNDRQGEWLKERSSGAPEIMVRGLVDFSDDPTIEIDIPARSILALDVPVQLHLWRPANGFVDHYSTPEFAEEYFMGLAEAADRLGAVLVWKGKRHGTGPISLAYRRSIDAAAAKVPFIALDPALSSRRLARHAGACVASPFTSAALLFEAGGGSAAYFDATGRLPAEKVQTDGLAFLQDRKQLTAWLEKILDGRAESMTPRARPQVAR